ncbi:MAG: zinc dependent phospholipase C family protein [Spirochaetia bacterium]|nr:zinc dependent phospholipase C family protein [Spirochaetia bacterium]
MAAKITHLEVLKQSLVLLEHADEKSNKTAAGIKDEFRFAALGAVAPDIFYYYHVLSANRNPVGLHWGNLSHHSRVFPLMMAFLDGVKKLPEGLRKKKAYAFAMGYISHCTVDIVTHPYIFYITGDYYSIDLKQAVRAQENHLRVEYHLDAYLLHHRWGMEPSRYNFIQYVDVREKSEQGWQLDYDIWDLWVHALADVYGEEFENSYFGSTEKIYEGDILNDSYMGFMRFNRILDTRSAFVRGVLTVIDYATFHRIKARYLLLPPGHEVNPKMVNEERKEWKYPGDPTKVSNDSFMDLVHKAAKFCAEAITDADAYINGSKKRSDLAAKYDGFNLDTGLRSDSLEMSEFDPLDQD